MTRLERLLTAYESARAAVNIAQEALINELLESPRGCVRCGEPITRRAYEGTSEPLVDWATRSHCSTRCGNGAWSREEDRILRREYSRGGSGRARRALAAAGFERTIKAVRSHALLLGVKYDRSAKPVRKPSRKGLTAATVLRVVREYRGLPLSPAEVIDHLGFVSDNQRSKAAKFLRELEELGEVSVKIVDGKPAYFDQAAWSEAA